MGKEAAEAVKDAVYLTACCSWQLSEQRERAFGVQLGVRRVIKTGISAEKRINIKVSAYSSRRRELLVISAPPTDVSTTTKMQPETI